MTGYGQAADRTRSQAAGFAAHLVKPVSASQLYALLNEP
jgi:CheY-like chemotaxis protein